MELSRGSCCERRFPHLGGAFFIGRDADSSGEPHYYVRYESARGRHEGEYTYYPKRREWCLDARAEWYSVLRDCGTVLHDLICARASVKNSPDDHAPERLLGEALLPDRFGPAVRWPGARRNT
jgi:hypothetical protein